MKIFLAWSGTRSFEIAKALNAFLRRVIQAVDPFFSNEIEKGVKWARELDKALEGTRFGIVCLTPDNLESTWIHYETGALAKTEDALIWTYLNGLKSGDVPQPIGNFQHTVADKEETLKLLTSINKRLAEVGLRSLSEEILRESFEQHWPQLEKELKAAMTVESEKRPEAAPRTRDEKLDEILDLLRSQQPIEVPRPEPKKASGVAFFIPADVTESGRVLSTYEEVFREFCDATMKIKATDKGVSVITTFSPPILRSELTKVLDTVEHLTGWRPPTFNVLKVRA